MRSRVPSTFSATAWCTAKERRPWFWKNGPPPNGKWADLAVLEPARSYKARHASMLLTFDAVVDAIAQIEAARQEQP